MARTLPGARQLALVVLRDVERRSGFSNRLLSFHLERFPDLDPRDRRLVTHLVYGVLRHRSRLDTLINRAASRPAGLRGELRDILRIGAFELRELDRPVHVVGSQTQVLLRALDPQRKLVGVATAILTQIDQHGAAWDNEASAGKPLDSLEQRWSIPRWLAGRWIKRVGVERALARAQGLSQVPSVDLRVDTTRLDAATARERLLAEQPQAHIDLVPEQPQCLRVRGAGDVFYGPLHEDGLVSVQALGSQQAVRALELAPGQRVLDACAGQGVKTAHIVEALHRQGEVVAVDINPERQVSFEQTRLRCGFDASALQVRQVLADLRTRPDLGLGFDAVLLDAPCTGLGNLARHPELRWSVTYDDIGDRAALQRELLQVVSSYVRPGGRLVYAVCSLEQEEGVDVVQGFFSQTDWRLELESSWSPEEHQADGFYLARVRAP